MSSDGPILRIFEVHAKPNCAGQLLKNFSVTSANVVRGEPGNHGYFFGSRVEGDGDRVVFASMWESLDAVKARFGPDWQSSLLPDGYEELIEEHSVRHFNLGDSGWHVKGLNG